MRDPITVTKVVRTSARPESVKIGVLAYLFVVLNNAFGVEVLLRRGADGRPIVVYREHRDRWGRSHAVARPMDARAQADLERQIFAKIGIDPSDARPAP